MTGGKYPKYSALMSVYKNEKPECLLASIASVLYQTVLCDEFILVEDGPLTNELYDVINKCDEAYPGIIKEVKLDYNLGLGLALNAGINHCKNELIARFDSDDISTKDRCEKQLEEFAKDPELDIIGTNHIEFIDDIANKESFLYKKLPESDEEIEKYAKKRNPFSHSAVMYRKSAVIKAGNYRDYHYVEDYDLWVRMIKSGAKCKNINEYLSYVKVSKDLYKRRGGIKYMRSIQSFKKELLKTGYFSRKEYYVSVVPHSAVCLMPSHLRKIVYAKMLRGQ